MPAKIDDSDLAPAVGYKQPARWDFYRLAILGGCEVGKTALTTQFYMKHFIDTYEHTTDDSYRKDALIDGQACMLEIQDTSGLQQEYETMREQWLTDSEGFVLVYSITDRRTFKRVKDFHDDIRWAKSDATPSTNVPIILVGNKSDRYEERDVAIAEGASLAQELNCIGYVESSAKTYTNVQEVFYDVVRALRQAQASQERPRQNTRLLQRLGARGKRLGERSCVVS